MLDARKHLLRDQLALPPRAVLVALGLAAHPGVNALLRRPQGAATGLLAPLVLPPRRNLFAAPTRKPVGLPH